MDAEKIGTVLTLEEAARRLSLSPWTLRGWVNRKKIGYVRIGRRIALPEAEVERLLREGYHPADVT